MNMKKMIVTSCPPWNSGSTNASPMNPPSCSHSVVIIGMICADEVRWKYDGGKRSSRR